MNALILYNQPAGQGAFRESEAGVLAEVKAVGEACEAAGIAYRSAGIHTLEELPAILGGGPEQVVFNLVEALQGQLQDVNKVPAVCNAFGRECTGSDTLCLSLTLDKTLTKYVMAGAGLPVPGGVAVAPGQELDWQALPDVPHIIKPANTDASEGIQTASCFFRSPAAGMTELVRSLQAETGGTVLVEHYAGHRELNVALLEINGAPAIVAIAEIDFSAFGDDRPRIVDYAAKWCPESFEYNNTPRLLPAPLSPEFQKNVENVAIAAWHACGCRDYARVDMRLDDRDNLFVLEVNANPDISPDAGFAAALGAAGIDYAVFVKTIIGNAQRRLSPRNAKAANPVLPDRAMGMPVPASIRFSSRQDREPVLALIRETGFFRDNEVDVAAEVFDHAIEKGAVGHYQSFVLLQGGMPVGWVCFGPTPCSEGTYDLYWIAVSPSCQGKGVGKALMAFAEDCIRSSGGRLIIIETSGRPDYESTRRFYLALGYAESARIRDFYAPNDDKVVYTGCL